MVQDWAEDGEIRPAGSDSLEPVPGGARPPIIVEGGEAARVDLENGQLDHVDVMARLREQMGDVSHADAVGGPTAPPVEAEPADTPPGPVEDVAESPPPVVTEADADVVAVTPQVEPVDALAPSTAVRPTQPVVRSHRGSCHNGSRRPSPRPAHGSPTAKMPTEAPPASTAFCPYCALLLEPPPASNQRCSRCRQRIIVKHIEGRAVFLTEAAMPVFVAERRRVAASGRLTRERERWLRLAAAAGAPAESQARLAGARLTEGVVVAARTLYLTTVDRAFRLAKREHDWDMASRLRREKATVLYRVAGSPLPPPVEFVEVFREGVAAELRGLAEISRDAELVSASCCDVCRADDRLISRISQELRVPRLPHEGCPKGLCRCHWDLAERKRTTMRRYLRRRPRTESVAPPRTESEAASQETGLPAVRD
jgi:hypothetical protein